MKFLDDFLIIILSAVLMGGLAYITWSQTRWREWTSRFTLSRAGSDRMFCVMIMAYIFLFSTLAILRYLTFHTGYYDLRTAWDLGQYGQLVWNSLNGRLMQGTFVHDTATFLGKSFTPILLGLVPLYTLWQTPIVLLVVQVVALGLGGLPIYWFARQRLGGVFALIVAAAYYLYPGLEHIGLTEFHEIALAIPLLSFATLFLLRQHNKGFLVCLVLALLVKEEIALIGIMFGVYIFLFQRRRWLGFGIAVASAMWIVVLIQFLIPFFRGAEYGGTFYYFGDGAIGGGGSRYSYLGRSIPEIMTTLVTRPDRVLPVILTPEKIAYVLHLIVPLAFAPLFGFETFMLALPTLAYSLLSTYGLQYEIRSYYFSPLLPFLFFALVTGIQRALRWNVLHPLAWKFALASLLVVSSVGSYAMHAPGPFARYFQPWRYVFDDHARRGNELLASIPSDAVVVGQNEFLAHLSNRRSVYEIPVIPDYRQADYVFGDSTASWYRVHLPAWEGYRKIGYFETIVEQDGFWFARRKLPDHSLAIRFGDALTLLGYSIVPTDTVRGGETFRPVFEWRVEQPSADPLFITARVLDSRGHLWAEEGHVLHNGATKLTVDQVGRQLGEQSLLRLPPTMPTGEYALSISVQISGTTTFLPARDGQNQSLGDEPIVARVRIEKDKRSYTASQLLIEQPLFVDLREMRFLGSTNLPQSIRAGDELRVGLYWRARSKPQSDYVIAVQLRDVSGSIAFEHASRPANDSYPTTQWNAGEVLLDWHDLALPPGISEGDYRLFVLLRDASTGQTIGDTLISTVAVRR